MRRAASWFFLWVVGAGCWILASASCGYHTAGHAGQMPDSVKTIAVPAFKNETSTYHIEELLTTAVVVDLPTPPVPEATAMIAPTEGNANCW